MTPAEAYKRPLVTRTGKIIPLWDDPRLSPRDRHTEWLRGHLRDGYSLATRIDVKGLRDPADGVHKRGRPVK